MVHRLFSFSYQHFLDTRNFHIVPKVFRGTHVNHPRVKSYTGKRIKLSGATLAYADGEHISGLPIEILVSGSALKTWING